MAINKAFVVKHGLEVNQKLILANATNNRVGIGTSIPQYTLHVLGGIGATDARITGVATVLNELRVGTGGTIFSVIAGPTGFGQSVGVGTANPAFLLDVRSPVSTGQTALYVQGDARITGDLIVDDLVFDQADVTQLNVSGISTFVGFSSFRDSVSIEDNLYVAGITTVAANGGITTTGGDFYVGGNFYSNGGVIVDTDLYIIGIATIGTLDVLGLSTTRDLYVAGFSTFVGFSTFQDSVFIQDNLQVSGVSTFVGFSTFNDYVDIQDGLRVLGVSTFAGITTVTGETLFTNQLSVSGVSTLSNVDINAGDIEVSNIDTTDLTVSGITTLGTVKVSSGIITATSGIVTYYGDGSYLTGNARNLTATIGIGTSGSVVGYGVSFLDLRGPGLSTVYYDNGVGIATIYLQGGGGGATIGIGTTPGEAFVGVVTAGNLWYNSSLGRTFIYYQDVDSAQWVDASPSNVGVITSLINVSFAPGSATSPSMYFVGDSQTGFFSPGAGQFTVVSVGSSILNINPSGINVTGIVTSTRLSTGNVVSSGIVTAQDFDALSDINYKENINTVNGALLKVEQMRGVKFNWKESGSPSYGVIAQELLEVLPELVHGENPKTVNYNGIIGVLIEAIKELKAEVEELKNTK
jgi:hypothetical protein